MNPLSITPAVVFLLAMLKRLSASRQTVRLATQFPTLLLLIMMQRHLPLEPSFSRRLYLDLLGFVPRWLKIIRKIFILIFSLFLFLWCLTHRTRYKRPKHVICAAMPWTISPRLVILWGVCWMFYNSLQVSAPAGESQFGINHHSTQPGGSLYPFIGYNLDSTHQDSGHFNEFGQFGGASIGTFDGPQMQMQAEPGQNIPGLQQQQAGVPSSQSHQALASHDICVVQKQSLLPKQALGLISCTSSGCQSSFGTERELQRHQQTIHGKSKYPCEEIGCNRNAQDPFNRYDNLQRHIRTTHGQSEQTPTTAPHNVTTRGKKRIADTSSQSVCSPESRRRKIEDAKDGVAAVLNSLPASGHSQDEVARLQEQLAEARRRENVHVARIKVLEKEVEAHAAKFEALKEDNEVQDAYIKILRRKG